MIDEKILHRIALNSRDVYTDKRPFHKKGNAEFYLDEVDGVQEVTVRGSDKPTTSSGFLDWLKNLDVRVWKFHGFEIARGFDPVNVVRGLKEQGLSKSKPVRLGGHSRGGTLAQTAAIELAADGYEIDQVVTFGAPRFSREAIQTDWNVWQFNAWGDIVPRCPFWPLFAWRHVGTVFRVGNFYSFRNVLPFGLFRYTRGVIRSHLMPRYIELLKVPERN